MEGTDVIERKSYGGIVLLLLAANLPTPARAQGPNSWTTGANMPTAVFGPATGVIGGLVYVVGGEVSSGAQVNINQIYNPAADTWTTGAPMPTARFGGVGAVANNILYVIGGSANGMRLNVVEAFDPAANTWSTKSSMPTPRNSIAAVVEGGIIYVIGGFENNRLATVESYNPATDAWTDEAPLLVAKSLEAAGLLGSVIVAAGGLTNSGDVTGDNEGYNASTNSWQTLTPDPTARQAACFGTISGQLYVAAGRNDAAGVNVVESFNLETNRWTTLAPTPLAQIFPGYATVGNLLYCFGGSNNGSPGSVTVYNNLEIYHPPAPPAPAISAGGVVSAGAFGGFTSVAPGSWIEIYGSNLAADTRPWAGTDFSGENAPTSLDGTFVTVGGQSAFVDYISPGQVNAQVPSNVSAGVQQITVKTDGGASSPFNITVNEIEPGLLAPASFNVGGIQYAVALFSDGTYVLPEGAISGIASRPAKPGDTIVLYGVGFGPVTPDIPAGQIVQQSNMLVNSLEVSLGGTTATLTYRGLSPNYVGLYQFNLIVPNIATSDAAPLTFTLGGVAGTQTLYLAVQN
jgi:uncharacterized protein (TIGR03437 family)